MDITRELRVNFGLERDDNFVSCDVLDETPVGNLVDTYNDLNSDIKIIEHTSAINAMIDVDGPALEMYNHVLNNILMKYNISCNDLMGNKYTSGVSLSLEKQQSFLKGLKNGIDTVLTAILEAIKKLVINVKKFFVTQYRRLIRFLTINLKRYDDDSLASFQVYARDARLTIETNEYFTFDSRTVTSDTITRELMDICKYFTPCLDISRNMISIIVSMVDRYSVDREDAIGYDSDNFFNLNKYTNNGVLRDNFFERLNIFLTELPENIEILCGDNFTFNRDDFTLNMLPQKNSSIPVMDVSKVKLLLRELEHHAFSMNFTTIDIEINDPRRMKSVLRRLDESFTKHAPVENRRFSLVGLLDKAKNIMSFTIKRLKASLSYVKNVIQEIDYFKTNIKREVS